MRICRHCLIAQQATGGLKTKTAVDAITYAQMRTFEDHLVKAHKKTLRHPTYILTPADNYHGMAIQCLKCGLTSHNPNDVEYRFCGRCHVYHPETPEELKQSCIASEGKLKTGKTYMFEGIRWQVVSEISREEFDSMRELNCDPQETLTWLNAGALDSTPTSELPPECQHFYLIKAAK